MRSIIKELETRLNHTVTVEMVKKNNGVSTKGYCIHNGNCNPVFYPPEEMSPEDAVEFIVNAYNSVGEPQFDTNVLTDRDYVLNNIKPCVINADKNRDKLNELIFKPFLDLAKVWRVNVDGGSFLLTRQLAEQLNIAADDIDRTRRQYLFEDFLGMPVITTADNYYGASAICDKDYLTSVLEKLSASSIYIIPSSVHELIVFDTETIDNDDVNYLKETICSVNSEVVRAEDFLSDNLYRYDGKDVVLV